MNENQISEIFEILLTNSKEAICKKEVPVSCCFVEPSPDYEAYKIISIAHNLTNFTKNATKHCEMLCIDSAIKQGADLQKCIAFVTVEPCLMCGYALKLAKISKVYYILPNDKFGGVESLFKIDLVCEKINYKKDVILGLLKGFYETGNDRLEPSKRHRFKPQAETEDQTPQKKIKEE